MRWQFAQAQPVQLQLLLQRRLFLGEALLNGGDLERERLARADLLHARFELVELDFAPGRLLDFPDLGLVRLHRGARRVVGTGCPAAAASAAAADVEQRNLRLFMDRNLPAAGLAARERLGVIRTRSRLIDAKARRRKAYGPDGVVNAVQPLDELRQPSENRIDRPLDGDDQVLSERGPRHVQKLDVFLRLGERMDGLAVQDDFGLLDLLVEIGQPILPTVEERNEFRTDAPKNRHSGSRFSRAVFETRKSFSERCDLPRVIKGAKLVDIDAERLQAGADWARGRVNSRELKLKPLHRVGQLLAINT